MSSEEQTDNLSSAAQRNHSHTPTPSVEASLISSQLFTTSASLLDCVDSTNRTHGLQGADRSREDACRLAGWKENPWCFTVVRSVWYLSVMLLVKGLLTGGVSKLGAARCD